MDIRIGRIRFIALLICIAAMPLAARAASCPALLQQDFTTLNDAKPLPLCQFAGKVILVVNTASYCGYTRQFSGLEALYQARRNDGLVVIGFPSNDFKQEAGSEQQIAEFCRLTYGVKFPMASRTSVHGEQAHPFFRRLAGITGSAPQWNFHKYLISRDARQVVAFDSATEPDDKALRKKIDEFLAAPTP